MKSFISIFLFLIIFTSSSFSQIAKKEIKIASENFIKSEKIFNGYSIDKKNKIQELYYNNTLVAYLIQLKPQGFVILSSSKNTYPVFGYSNQTNLNIKNADSKALNILLSSLYQEKKITENKTIKNNNLIKKNNTAWNKILSKSKAQTSDYQYGYWMNNVWGGVNCYNETGGIIHPSNYFTPNHYSPGCVATSTSQILHYYNWPLRGTGTHTDIDNSGSSTGSYYAKFVKTEYDWANMLDEYYYKSSSDIQQRAIGRLAYHCAVATDMDFENEGSTANINRIPNALSSYFRFTGHFENRAWSNFISRTQNNLENGHPIILAARADNGDEHAFVCDGYRYNDGEDKYYHLNMGWWNAYGLNGWYRIFNSGFNVGGYNTILSGIFDIMPIAYMDKPIYTSDTNSFFLRWQMPKNVNVTAYKIEENFNNGSWSTITSSVTDTFFLKTKATNGLYKYRVTAQIDGIWYANTTSNYVNVPVGKSTYLYFDGDDSFFVKDNIYNDLDVNNSWTFESWVEVNTYTNGNWNVIMDRENVFSLYLLDDDDADFAVKFAVRDNSGNIITSLSSNNSSVNLELEQWFHVAVSFDGTTARLFVNGYLVDELANANFILSNSTKYLNIGARYRDSYSRYLDGRIDEIRISDIARYTESFCPSRFNEFSNDKNTRLLLHLNNFTGTDIYDESHHLLGISLRTGTNEANWASSNAPIILSQANSHSIYQGTSKFGIVSYNANNYQWQVNNSGNFENTIDGSIYSGSQTDTISINVSTLSGQYHFRNIAYNSNMFTCSNEVYLNVIDNYTIWNGTSWNNGEPNNSLSAIIDANYTTSSDLEAENIIINKNDTLFISAENTFTTKYLENNGTIVLKADFGNNFSGALITDSLLNYGEMIAEKLIAAPNLIQQHNQNIINSPLNSSYSFSNICNSNLNILENNSSHNNWTEADSEGNMSNKKAYLFQAISPEIIQFKGTFNTNEVTFNLQQGWNLIYNPYSSPIDWNKADGWTKQGISNAIYFLDPNNNGNAQNFSIFNGLVNTFSANKYINTMQGFYIYATEENSVLKINKNAKVKNSEIQDNACSLTNYLKFKFENEIGESDEGIIYFSNIDSNYLKIEPLGNSKTYTYIISSGEKYCVSSINQDIPNQTVQVGFQNSQAGNCTFSIIDYNFSVPVVLKDMFGDTTTLNLNKEYQFSASSNEPVNRFRIYFGNFFTNLDKINNTINIYSDGKTINISTENKSTANIYDITGRNIYTKNFTDKIQINNLKSGIYIIEIFNKNEYKTKKLIINY